MQHLPSPLLPWRQYLAWFDDELAAALGDLLRRLQPLLAPLHARESRGDAIPDGIDDLRRRGSYERLLLSEWALAEAEPDEFLRRAIAGEHVFLSPRLVRPRSRLHIVALFDSGPGQLGAPRLVQLALAILLAQRAERLGAQFGWGSLQGDRTMHGLSQASDLQQLLTQRQWQTADADMAAFWRVELAHLPQAPAECWVVSDQPQELPATHTVQLRRCLDGSVALSMASARAQREAVLPPLPPRAAVRLLRGEFTGVAAARKAAVKSAGHRIALTQPPLLDRSGQRLAVALLGGNELLLVQLSDRSGAAASLSSQQWRRNASLIGAVFNDGRIGGVLSVDGHLRGWKLGGFKAWSRPPPEEFKAATGQGRWLRGLLQSPTGNAQAGNRLLLLDHAGNLADWTSSWPRGATNHATALTRQVLALHDAATDQAIVAIAGAGQIELQHIPLQGPRKLLARTSTVHAADTAFLAGRLEDDGWNGSCAYASLRGSNGPSHWKLLHYAKGKFQPGEASTPEQVRIVGLAVNPQAPQTYAPLGLDASRRRLHVYTPQAQEIHLSDVEIQHAALSDNGERVALINARRELLLIDVASQRLLLHLGSDA